MLSLQIALNGDMKIDDNNWKRTSVFRTTVMYRGKLFLSYIGSGSAVNGISQELVDQLKLLTKLIKKPYQVSSTNRR